MSLNPAHSNYWMELDEPRESAPAPDGSVVAHDHAHEARDAYDAHDVPDANDGVAVPGSGPAWSLSRRSFLVAAGFATAGTLAACSRAPTQKAASSPTQPEDVVPGRATWYASTCGGCSAGCGVLVKCVDGRPIKVEGNPAHPISAGGLCAVGQATVLGLYDSRRKKRPTLESEETTWAAADAKVTAELDAVRASGGAVRVLTRTVTSPTTQTMLDAFLASFSDARHVMVDALSASAVLAAHEKTHGARVFPRIRFEKAKYVVGVDADFLGTWVSPVEFTKGYRASRSLDGRTPKFATHVQVESALSLTGSNADVRVRLAPAQIPGFVAHLAARVAERSGATDAAGAPPPSGPPPVDAKRLDEIADGLLAARPNALVVCGRNDVATQTLVNACNASLGAYGVTLDLEAPSRQRLGDDAALAALVAEMEQGKVAALVVANANPVVDSPLGRRLLAAMKSVKIRVALAERDDETTAGCAWVLPSPHPLEAWDDAEPVAGVVTVAQPAIRPIYEPRTLRECLAAWAKKPQSDYDLVKRSWTRDVLPRQRDDGSPVRDWNRAVHDGFVAVAPRAQETHSFDRTGVVAVAEPAALAEGGLALVLFTSVGMLDGRHAHNPWLHECPDPIAKTVWGNTACLSPATAKRLGIDDGDIVRVAGSVGGTAEASIELPALVQPGTADGVVAVALGYGRVGTDRFARVGPPWLEAEPTVAQGGTVGADASPLLAYADGAAVYAGTPVRVTRTGQRETLARSQTYSTQVLPANTAPKGAEKRDAVRETTLAAFVADPAAGTPKPAENFDVWAQDHEYTGHRWGMVIDLAACTGCSACVVACQAENNVPVVGKDEVRRRRDLQWMRIDRYYEDTPAGAEGGAEHGGDVSVVHQPMLCQHCENAPCETVCPVLATVHSSEGLNAQVYNRCVGTRYCANNCPYKTRRFNWFDYRREDPLADLVLNPDVTVRSRGVMEKCSFCVQRIHEGKAEAKRRGAVLSDGEVKTACQQSCPAGAIVFGDVNDEKSAVARLAADPRRYRVLDELNVRPSVSYLTKVRARAEVAGGKEGSRHG